MSSERKKPHPGRPPSAFYGGKAYLATRGETDCDCLVCELLIKYGHDPTQDLMIEISPEFEMELIEARTQMQAESTLTPEKMAYCKSLIDEAIELDLDRDAAFAYFNAGLAQKYGQDDPAMRN